MRGKPAVLVQLNILLALEISSCNQYMVHAAMCANWDYECLAGYIRRRAITEMYHTEKLIGRILFLEGTPNVAVQPHISIGSDVESILDADLAAENVTVAQYNAAIQICLTEQDAVTHKMLQEILRDEEEHVNGIEARIDQISQMGREVFLSAQV